MVMKFSKNLVLLSGVVSVDEAESLLEWLQKKASSRVDFSKCEHVHPANIQTLLAAGTTVAAWPDDSALASWLRSIFKTV